MPYDSDAKRPESGRPSRPPTGWRLWVTSPRHLVVTTAAIVAIGLLLGELITLLFLFPPQGRPRNLTRVPDVVGLTADEARAQAERRGLEYLETLGIPHGQPAGVVVAQEPLAGQMAQPASSLEVTLSLGPAQRPVPDIVGLNVEQAENALRQAGFEVEVTAVDAAEDVGRVVETRPPPGTALELPGRVRLMVSAGSRNVPVPELAMLSLSEAQATLERLGLRLGRVSQDSAGQAAAGTVIAQSPAAGQRAARGSRVSVTVSSAQAPAVDSARTPADTSSTPPDTTGT